MIRSYSQLDFSDYELIDSGNEQKLERFGAYTLVRPEPKAIWHPTKAASLWNNAHAMFQKLGGAGIWKYNGNVPNAWNFTFHDLKFSLGLTGFKHVGVFPEQSVMWEFMQNTVTSAKRELNVLNLFGYTGGATLACSSAGAKVTHLDASKDVVTWARENAVLSGLGDKPVRWIVDDAVKFVKREINRGVKYDAIIMDPPKFGRGTNGEVWKIEEDLPRLMDLCTQILTPNPAFMLINAYTVSFSSQTLANILDQTMRPFKGTTEGGELLLNPKNGSYPISTSIFARWSLNG